MNDVTDGWCGNIIGLYVFGISRRLVYRFTKNKMVWDLYVKRTDVLDGNIEVRSGSLGKMPHNFVDGCA